MLKQQQFKIDCVKFSISILIQTRITHINIKSTVYILHTTIQAVIEYKQLININNLKDTTLT